MKTSTLKFAASALTALVTAAAVGPALASPRCDAGPKEQWQPREALQKKLTDAGWKAVDRIKVEDGCYEAKGKDDKGRKAEVYFDPKTLQQVAK